MNINKSLPQGGFTLIEILVVLGVISLMSSVVFASTNSVRGKARDAARLENLHSIEIALELYYNKYSVYPCGAIFYDASMQYQLDLDLWQPGGPTTSFLDSVPLSLPVCSGNPTTGLVTEGLITYGLRDPGKGFIYYGVDVNRKNYILVTQLEDSGNIYKMANDGGTHSCYYEIGPGLGTVPIFSGFSC